MTPVSAILWAQFTVVGAVWIIAVKWWTIWFVLGQQFRRTTRFCVGVVLWQASVSAALLASHAVQSSDVADYPVDGFSGWAWLVAAGVCTAAGAALETWWLRTEMRRTVRVGWTWRRYDRFGYAFSHGACLVGAIVLTRLI